MRSSLSLLFLLIPLLNASDLNVGDFSQPVRSDADHSKDSAVIIGIEDYAFLPDVPYANNDADAFYDLMVYTRRIPSERIQKVQNANLEKMKAAVERAGKETKAGGVVWIFYAGHGAASSTDSARMFVGVDAQTDIATFNSRSIKVDELTRLATAGGGQVMLMVDACYTGAGRTGATLIEGSRYAVPVSALSTPRVQEWAATSEGQIAMPLDSMQHGAFTYFTIAAMRGAADGEMDGKKDGNISVEEMKLWVNRKLRETQTVEQTPVLLGGSGNFLLVSGLPEEVRGKDVVLTPTPAENRNLRPTTPQTASVKVEEPHGAHLGGGFEVGVLSGIRLEEHLNGNSKIKSVGIRALGGLGLLYFSSPAPGLGGVLFFDRKRNESSNWELELSIGGGVLSSGAAFAGVAAQYDPPSAFQLNLGGIVAIGPSFGILPDISAGFIW